MKRFQVNSTYKQFYVADAQLEPNAPEEWTDTHLAQRHSTQQSIVGLCPVGDITASVISIGPDEALPEFDEQPDFEVKTKIEIPSGRVGIYGWPWELQDEHKVDRGGVVVRFYGYALDQAGEQKDYYVVKVSER